MMDDGWQHASLTKITKRKIYTRKDKENKMTKLFGCSNFFDDDDDDDNDNNKKRNNKSTSGNNTTPTISLFPTCSSRSRQQR